MRPLHSTAFMADKPQAAAPPVWPQRAPLRVEWHRPRELTQQDRRRWADLSIRAAPGNIFAADWFMEPALRHCGTGWSLRLAIVRGVTGDWLGALPMTMKASIGGRLVPSWHSWHAPNQPLGTPLVLPGAEKAFWQALLAQFDRHPGSALGLSFGAMPDDLAATLALADLCAEQGRTLHQLDRFTRPARRTAAFPDPNPAMVAANNALDQELDQMEAHLAQALGPVSLVLHDCAEDCEPWLAAFFALERAGGRARACPALATTPATSVLFRDLVRQACRRGVARLASLRAGEQIVAMTCWLRAGRYAYGLRMAHDEAWARFAPERLLMRRIARMACAEPPVLFDSGAAAGTPSDSFWPEQRALGTLAMGIGSAPRRKLFDALISAGQR
jgi:CelD/BcsL family acetyltransferase involved in cellulose biosynthesis